MNYANHLMGQRAEQKACDFLLAKGLSLLQKNFSCYYGEIDLIMKDQDHIVFIEVRYRHRSDYGHALESINFSKRKKIIKAATYFLQKKVALYAVTSRFDIVTIQHQAQQVTINWIKNAFDADIESN